MRWIPIILGSCLMLACIAGSVANLVNYDLLGLLGFVLCGVAAAVLTIAALIRFSEKTNAPVQFSGPPISEVVSRAMPAMRDTLVEQVSRPSAFYAWMISPQEVALMNKIAQAKRNKKKHSHLQAELDRLRGV